MNGVQEEVETFSIDFGELHCQFLHDHSAVPKACKTCLQEVTHIVEAECGRAPAHLCDSATTAIQTFLRGREVVVCKTCKRPCYTHWTVRPI